MEDPAENLFVETIVSPFGDFRGFPGVVNGGLFDAECVIEAFSRLPPDEQKDDALKVARAALLLSEAVVSRTGLPAGIVGDDHPFEEIRFPGANQLGALAARVLFSRDDLADFSVSVTDLAPLLLSEEMLHTIRTSPPGESPLEIHPLLLARDGIIVASPASLALAASAHLIDVAVKCEMGEALRSQLCRVHMERIEEAGWLRCRGRPRRFGDRLILEFGYEESAGRYVHVLYTLPGFEDWPKYRFGKPAAWDAAFAEEVVGAIGKVRGQLGKQPQFREGLTLLILGGWGNPQLSPIPGGSGEDWRVITLVPHDAVTLGLCEDGSIPDLWRIYKQADRLAAEGFEVFGPNDPVNLFEAWRRTSMALLPPGERGLRPPMTINYPTGWLRQARHEAWRGLGRRSAVLPDGERHVVHRIERRPIGEPEDVFGSLAAAHRGRRLGMAAYANHVWWVEVAEGERGHSDGDLETWLAALHWAVRVMRPFLAVTPVEPRPVHLTLEVGWPEERAARRLSDEEVGRSVSVIGDRTSRTARIRLAPEWQQALYRPDNLAEVTLAAAMMEAVCRIEDRSPRREDLLPIAHAAAGSPDARWRHVLLAQSIVDQMGGLGLLHPFRSISLSAGALAKCGMAWRTRSRSEPQEIRGKADCTAFLEAHVGVLRSELIAKIRTFNRVQLVGAALCEFQAALWDGRQWEQSTRAHRALWGEQSARSVSFQRETRVNAVVRACSIIAEMAAVEAPLSDGRKLGRMDLEELQAEAMLLWLTQDTLAAMHGDCIEPLIRMSASGDILTDRTFEDAALKRSAELRHARDRDRAEEEYISRFDDPAAPAESDTAVREQLLAALEDEFHDANSYLDLPVATLELAKETSGRPVLMMRRSDLAASLANLSDWTAREPSATLERLTLERRAEWSTLPAGSTASDFDHAKFDRRFSLVGQPLLALTDGSDPVVAIAPAVLERAVKHNLAGAATGALQGVFWSSQAMRTFASRRGAAAGLEFNDAVAARVASLGLNTWASAKPSWCLNHKATDALKQLGDVDVLAVSPDKRVVWVIEAKDLKLCRTQGEAARRLSDYRGRLRNGSPDKMLRHLRRVEYLRAHASDLCARLDLPSAPAVRGLVVVQAPQPMQFHALDCGPDGPVLMFDELQTIPWSRPQGGFPAVTSAN